MAKKRGMFDFRVARTEVLAPNGAWLSLPPVLARKTETQLRKWLNARGLIGVKEGNRVWILGNDNAVKKAERLFIEVGGTKKNPPQMTCDVCGLKAEAKTHPCRFENGCTCWRGVPCRKRVTGLQDLRNYGKRLLDNPRKNVTRAFEAWYRGKSFGKEGDSVWSNGSRIYSYRTWLVDKNIGSGGESDEVLLNVTKYSSTTTQQQNSLRLFLRQSGINAVEIDDVPRGASWAGAGGIRRNPRKRKRVRKNPPLVTFGNPGVCMSDNVVEIRYQHNEDGQYYKHKFKRGQVRLHASAGTKAAVLKRVDGKPLISDY